MADEVKMDVREKLVELLDIIIQPGQKTIGDIADHLIRHGVTVQEWVSVEDRLPEMGEHYQSEDVLVYIDYRPDDPDATEDTYVSIDHVFLCRETKMKIITAIHDLSKVSDEDLSKEMYDGMD